MNTTIIILDIFGTAVFAISGAIAAGRKSMDIFGMIVLGCVTALGGGTLRDVVLGITPVFWVLDTSYLAVAIAASIGMYVSACCFRLPAMSLLYADALGLATFMVIGFQKGYQATQDYIIAVIMGVVTGVVGGIIRDVLSGETPLIFRREIYASASFCGAALLGLLTYFSISSIIAIPVAFIATLAIRIFAVHHNLSLPIFKYDD